MTVRSFLVATAVAVLVGAQPSAALADAHVRESGGPANVASATNAVTIAAATHAKKTSRADSHPRRETGIFASENTPLAGASATHSTKGGSSAGGGSILRTVGGLLVVIGAIYAVAWVLRRVKRSRDEQASGRGLASLATLPLGNGRAVHLVRAGTDVILVGTSEHGVAPIQRYTEEEALANGVLSEYGQDATLRSGAESFTFDGPAVPPIGGATAVGQWRAVDTPRPGSGAGIVDALRRLTERK
jgi:flagellar protein FliO/FliZ